MKNGVWDIMPRPEDKYVVTSKWIYKIKHATDGSIEKYKARFVARGFSQLEGITMKIHLLRQQGIKLYIVGLFGSVNEMEHLPNGPNGCHECIPE